jgi:hypothetical protein
MPLVTREVAVRSSASPWDHGHHEYDLTLAQYLVTLNAYRTKLTAYLICETRHLISGDCDDFQGGCGIRVRQRGRTPRRDSAG